MTVLILERVPATLRGELSRWMIEPRPGVFVGKVSGLVRERLWDKARAGAKTGAGMLLYSSPTEQGFLAQSFGDTTRELADWEGLTLVWTPKAAAKEKRPRKANTEPASTELAISEEG